MTVLTVDSVHARYRNVAPYAAQRLDDALVEVAQHGLAEALLGRLEHPADHVCVRRLASRSELDTSQDPSVLVRSWSRDLAETLKRRLSDDPPADPDKTGSSDVVVYPRTADAIVDMLRGVARRDLGRVWAWQMVGLVGPDGSAGESDVARVLTANADLVPLVIARSQDLPHVPLTRIGWLAVAQAVARLHREVSGAGPGNSSAGDITLSFAGISLAQRLPWSVADPAQRRDLALLVLACTSPGRTYDLHTLTRIADAWSRMTSHEPDQPSVLGPDDLRTDTHAEDSRTGEAGRTGARTSIAGADTKRAEGPEPGRAGAVAAAPSELPERASEPQVSSVGGLMLLVRPLGSFVPALGEPSNPLSKLPVEEVLARLAARLADAPAQDPAVAAIAGWRHDSDVPERVLPVDQEQALLTLEGAVREWLTDRLCENGETPPTGTDLPADPLEWFWRRRVTLTTEPGWVEAGFALSDVDIRIRRAGLDLDPGYVWWLGSVVRYRYV